MNLIFDSGAVIAYLVRENGGDYVERLLRNSQHDCFIHAVNLCEIYYDFWRREGVERAESVVQDVLSVNLTVREDMDYAFWRQAGRYKAEIARISLADCFCLSLANRIGAEIVTADHHEFDRVAERGLCKVRFIR